MSYNENETDPADLRHETPHVPRNGLDTGEHIGNSHQEPGPIDPTMHGLPRRLAAYVPQEMLTRQGLHWAIGDGGIRFDLAAFPHDRNREYLGNVELRTIHAHLMEAVALARTEMRERGMVVDF